MKWVVSILFVVGATGAFAQGAFQDLDFEAANVIPISGQPGFVTTANALPGWTVTYDSVVQPEITYNSLSLGGTAAILVADGYPDFGEEGLSPLDGNFSLLLFASDHSLTISQTGQIPASSEALLFTWGGTTPAISVGGDSLTVYPVQTLPNGEILGVSISPWAGQTESLSFTLPKGSDTYAELDDISFSPNAITVTPEPSPFLLTGIGGLAFGVYRRIQAWRKC
ncbi:MAG TPA: hypothetical protein VGO67_08840 [Verrucomicrobiae bacterium]|jgi:hypothetical protein